MIEVMIITWLLALGLIGTLTRASVKESNKIIALLDEEIEYLSIALKHTNK